MCFLAGSLFLPVKDNVKQTFMAGFGGDAQEVHGGKTIKFGHHPFYKIISDLMGKPSTMGCKKNIKRITHRSIISAMAQANTRSPSGNCSATDQEK